MGSFDPFTISPAGEVEKGLGGLIRERAYDFAIEAWLDLDSAREVELFFS